MNACEELRLILLTSPEAGVGHGQLLVDSAYVTRYVRWRIFNRIGPNPPPTIVCLRTLGPKRQRLTLKGRK